MLLSVSSISHLHSPAIADFANKTRVTVTDAMQGQVMARFAISSGQAVKLFPSRTEPLLGALVVLNEVREKVKYAQTV